MSRLASRVARLEGGDDLRVVLPDRALSEVEKRDYAERYRQEHGLPAGTLIFVLDGEHDF